MKDINFYIVEYEIYNQLTIEKFCNVVDSKEYNIFERFLFYFKNSTSYIEVDNIDEKYYKFFKFFNGEKWTLYDLLYEILDHIFIEEFKNIYSSTLVQFSHLLNLNKYEDTTEIIKFNDRNGKEIILTIAEIKDFFEFIIKNRISHFNFEGRY